MERYNKKDENEMRTNRTETATFLVVKPSFLTFWKAMTPSLKHQPSETYTRKLPSKNWGVTIRMRMTSIPEKLENDQLDR